MRGAYCLLVYLSRDEVITVGKLGRYKFPRGIYAYAGSAQKGVGARVGRHARKNKKLRWHIDYLLRKSEIISVYATPASSKNVECRIASSLMRCKGAAMPVARFGSSDCRCLSHLVYLGDGDVEWIAESVSLELSMLDGAYQRLADSGSQ